MTASAPTTTQRMLLVDDHPIVRRGVRDILLHSYPWAVIEEVGCGADAILAVEARVPDIVFLDLTLPDGSGLDVLKDIRDRHQRLPVLILSMHAPDQFARRAIAAGASGYLTKETADEELVTATARLLRGGRYFGPQVLDEVAASFGAGRDTRPHERLSDREYQVLRLIGCGRPVSAIADALGLSVKTVSTYRMRVLEKMDLRSNAELIRYAVEHGLLDG